jgi:hypothetical protein
MHQFVDSIFHLHWLHRPFYSHGCGGVDGDDYLYKWNKYSNNSVCYYATAHHRNNSVNWYCAIATRATNYLLVTIYFVVKPCSLSCLLQFEMIFSFIFEEKSRVVPTFILFNRAAIRIIEKERHGSLTYSSSKTINWLVNQYSVSI